MTVLSIVNIGYGFGTNWDWSTKYVKVFLYFERIIEQTIHQRDYYNYGFAKPILQQTYLVPLINHQINRNKQKAQPIPKKTNIDTNNTNVDRRKKYIYALFEHFCDSKRDYINLTCINDEIKNMDISLIKILFKTKNIDKNSNKNKEYELNDVSLKLIFPNIKRYKNQLGYWIKLDHHKRTFTITNHE